MNKFESLTRKHVRSYKYALRGLASIFANQLNFKIEFWVAIFVILLSSFLQISRIEWLIVMFSIFLVLVCESLNSAIEAVCDALIKEYSEEIRYAKDIGAGAVLLSAIGSIVVGIIIFLPYLFKIF